VSTDTKVDKSHRDSLTAFLDSPELPPQTDEDVVVNCIEQRATQFQGHIPAERLESLQVVMCFLPLNLADHKGMVKVNNFAVTMIGLIPMARTS
jgi:hypothetical protein